MIHNEIADLIIENKGACMLVQPLIQCKNECQAYKNYRCECLNMSDDEVLQWFKNWKENNKGENR